MIITIDEGTTSTRALLIDQNGKIQLTVQKEIEQHYPQAAWVEHDANEIWQKTLGACRELIAQALKIGFNKEDITGIAITNQRETSIIWDPKTGKPIHNAIVWQCRRTSDYCNSIKNQTIAKNQNLTNYIKAKTGLEIDAYFSATKIKWLLENKAKKYDLKKLKPGELMFGTIDTWLIWNLTLGREHLTDATNASRTMLYDIHENKWDENLLDFFAIPKEILPRVQASNASYNSSPLFQDLLDKELPIKAVIGDQQAAFYAYNNQAKITYGTGTFVLIPGKTLNTKVNDKSFNETITKDQIAKERETILITEPKKHKGLLESIAYKKNDCELFQTNQLEGSIFVGGSIVQWLRDELKIIEKSSEIESLANQVTDTNGVFLIPALAGLGAPFWQGHIRGSIFGLTRATNKAHIARAALESIAFRVRDIFEVLDKENKEQIDIIHVDGGASKNDTLLQFQANLLQKTIRRYTETEMTALGAAKMTGEVTVNLEIDKEFKAQENLDSYYKEWQSYLNLLLKN